MKHEFPKFKYHNEKPAQLIHNSEEEEILGEGWENSPAVFGIETHPSVPKHIPAHRAEIMLNAKGDAAKSKKAQKDKEEK